MVSSTTRSEMFSQFADEGLLILLTIDHADLSVPIRVVNNNVSVTSRTNDFIAFPFDLALPSSTMEGPPKSRLTISNVTREIGEAIRSISSAPTVLIEVVRTDDFDSVELAFPVLKLRNARYDVGQVTGDILSEDLSLEPYPAYSFVPSSFPGIV